MPDKVDYKILEQIPLFKNISKDTLAQIASTCAWVTLEKNHVLFKQSDPSQNLYIVYEGEVRIVREYEDERITVAVLGPGQVTGELSMIIGEPRTATVEATQDSKLVCLERDVFFAHLGQDPHMATQLLIELGRRLQETNVMVRETALNNFPARIASLILFLAEDHEGHYKTGLVTSNFRLHRLARSAGIRPEIMNEILQQWSYDGYIGMDKRRLFLHDVKYLQQLAGWE
jgi:CRP/FNR family transcriptional regulator